MWAKQCCKSVESTMILTPILFCIIWYEQRQEHFIECPIRNCINIGNKSKNIRSLWTFIQYQLHFIQITMEISFFPNIHTYAYVLGHQTNPFLLTSRGSVCIFFSPSSSSSPSCAFNSYYIKRNTRCTHSGSFYCFKPVFSIIEPCDCCICINTLRWTILLNIILKDRKIAITNDPTIWSYDFTVSRSVYS